MATLKLLEKVYGIKNGKIVSVSFIESISKIFARTENVKLLMEYKDPSRLKILNESVFDDISYSLETPELIALLFKQNRITQLKNINWDAIPIEKINEVIGSVSPFIPEIKK